MPIGRNQPCPCGSGRKYKRCCLAKDVAEARQEAERARRRAENFLGGPAAIFEHAINRVRSYQTQKPR